MLWSAAGSPRRCSILIALYWRIAGFERSIPFAGIALLLAALLRLCHRAARQARRRARALPRPGALYATGTVAALALALTFALEKGWLTVALALMVPGIAWIAERRPLPMLRWLAAAIVVLVLARIGWEPRIVGSDVGTTPIFNWILYGYGVPAVSFWVAGHLLRKRADDQPSRMVDGAAILFTVLLVTLEIRHFINGGDIYRDSGGLAEVALQVCAGLPWRSGSNTSATAPAASCTTSARSLIAALAPSRRRVRAVARRQSDADRRAVGGPFINLILLGYGIPAVLAIALAMTTRGTRPNSTAGSPPASRSCSC